MKRISSFIILDELTLWDDVYGSDRLPSSVDVLPYQKRKKAVNAKHGKEKRQSLAWVPVVQVLFVLFWG